MNRLVLTADQTSKISTASGPIEIVDAKGRVIGAFTLTDEGATETKIFTQEEMADVKRRIESAQRDRSPAFKAEQIRPRIQSPE